MTAAAQATTLWTRVRKHAADVMTLTINRMRAAAVDADGRVRAESYDPEVTSETLPLSRLRGVTVRPGDDLLTARLGGPDGYDVVVGVIAPPGETMPVTTIPFGSNVTGERDSTTSISGTLVRRTVTVRVPPGRYAYTLQASANLRRSVQSGRVYFEAGLLTEMEYHPADPRNLLYDAMTAGGWLAAHAATSGELVVGASGTLDVLLQFRGGETAGTTYMYAPAVSGVLMRID